MHLAVLIRCHEMMFMVSPMGSPTFGNFLKPSDGMIVALNVHEAAGFLAQHSLAYVVHPKGCLFNTCIQAFA